MTHPLPIRPLMQRNPAWRLYGDNPITIEATMAWHGRPGRYLALRCVFNAGRAGAAARVASTSVCFGQIAPPVRG